MKPGDLLECPDGRRLFVDWYNRQANVFIVYVDQNHKLEIPASYVCTVIANITSNWPYVLSPKIKTKGAVGITASIPARGQTLKVFADCVVYGGALYLSPSLQLRLGETVQITYASGPALALPITASFGSRGQREARIKAKAQAPKSFFDKLMDEDL